MPNWAWMLVGGGLGIVATVLCGLPKVPAPARVSTMAICAGMVLAFIIGVVGATLLMPFGCVERAAIAEERQ